MYLYIKLMTKEDYTITQISAPQNDKPDLTLMLADLHPDSNYKCKTEKLKQMKHCWVRSKSNRCVGQLAKSLLLGPIFISLFQYHKILIVVCFIVLKSVSVSLLILFCLLELFWQKLTNRTTSKLRIILSISTKKPLEISMGISFYMCVYI